MDYFPAFLKLDGLPVLVVGGGAVAARKARALVDAHARVTIIAPETVSAVDALTADDGVSLHRRRFRDTDIDGHWLVVSATGDPTTERRVARAATRRRVFVNAVDDIDNCSYITPAIVDRSPLMVAISSGGAAPVLARRIRTEIERLLPARMGELARLAGSWRTRVGEALHDFGGRLRFWERVFDGEVASAAMAGDMAGAERRLEALLADSGRAGPAPGRAWLVGAGPGDPDLLTLKALHALQHADVILHDNLVSDEVLALARRDAERMPVGKRAGCTANSQEEINALLVRLVREGRRVCRLKGGDPFIFGRGGEEAAALDEAGLEYTVVPGITAAAGCAAAAGIPLTHRDFAQSVVLLTGHGKQSVDRLDWASLARDRQTLAVYMGVRRFPDIMRELTRHGRAADTPVAIIERGTTPDQRVVRGRLGQLPMLAAAHAIESPAMLIIGEVASLGAASGTAHSVATATSVVESAIQTA